MSVPFEVRLRRTCGSAVLLTVAGLAQAGLAQTIDDGVLMSKRSLCAGVVYGHDGWTDYWEGTLKRDNGNLGTVTTQSTTWTGAYGVTDRLNVIAEVPYVWTGASQGVLHGMSGFQDLTLAVKYRLLETAFTGAGSIRTIALVSAGTPLTRYTPDFQPLSIGLGSKTLSGRLTLDFRTRRGWFLTASGAYSWRGNVTLDRPAYFTSDQLYLTDQVEMPNVLDYTVSAGYMRSDLQVPVSFVQQRTQGGGDIRRQDMPFVSNRMNFSKVEVAVQYSLPRANGLALRAMGSYTVSGRNVGQATTLTAGLLYTFHF